jgi:hypothetical protein
VLGVVIDSDLEPMQCVVHGIAEELLQVADVDCGLGGRIKAHGFLTVAGTMAAGPRGC